MDETIENVVLKLQESDIYPSLFYKAFNDSMATGEYTLKALSSFLLTLVSSNSKYDKVMRNEAAFSPQELSGYELFKKHCASCHIEPLFTNDAFMNNGLSVDTILKDYGRFEVTKNPLDSFRFKVPTLRNIEFSYPYMHDGRFKKLSQVINHYTEVVQSSTSLATELENPVKLSSNEQVDLIAFMLTLTDKEFLFNQDYSFPREVLLR